MNNHAAQFIYDAISDELLNKSTTKVPFNRICDLREFCAIFVRVSDLQDRLYEFAHKLEVIDPGMIRFDKLYKFAEAILNRSYHELQMIQDRVENGTPEAQYVDSKQNK